MALGTWRGVKECAISRFPAVPKAPPERLSNPAISHKRAVFASPGSRVTKPPTEILTLQVKYQQYGGSVGHTRFVTRQSPRVLRVLNRLSEGIWKTFLRAKASTICRGTHPAFSQCKLMALSPRVKRTERVADHSSPSLADTENAWSSTLGIRTCVEVIIGCVPEPEGPRVGDPLLTPCSSLSRAHSRTWPAICDGVRKPTALCWVD